VTRPDRQVRVGLGRARVGWWRQRNHLRRCRQPPGDHRDLGGAAVRVKLRDAWNGVRPEHREIRLHHLAARRQVQPDLEQFQRIGRILAQQRKHLRVHHAAACREPLHIAATEACLRAERVGVVDQPLADDGHGLEAPVRVLGKARHRGAVVQAPAVLAAEVLSDVAAGQRGGRAHLRIAQRIGIVVVGAEQEGVGCLPRKTQRLDADDGVGIGHGGALDRAAVEGGGMISRERSALQAGAGKALKSLFK
jgi:hypothetical protein